MQKTLLKQKIALILLGVFLCAVLLEVGLRLGGLVILSLQEHKNRDALKQKGAYRIMCLGESTTIGQWPPFLEEILNQRNRGIKFSVIDKGVGKINTSIILGRLESNLNTYQPDMVITMMGINDRAPHMPYETVSNSKVIKFLRSFKIYNLARLLWLHIVTRFKEIASYKPDKHVPLQKDILEQVSTEEDNNSPPNEESLKKAVELNPEDAEAYTALAWFYQGQGRFAEAEEVLKKYMQLNPKDTEAYIALAQCYQAQGRFAEAEALLKKAIELNPGNPQLYILLGRLYRGQGKLTEAEESVKRAIELHPKDAGAHIALAHFYGGQNKFAEAEESFKRAIELNPKDAEVYTASAWCYRDQGKFAEAEEVLKKYIQQLDPGNYKLYAVLGGLYEEMGNPGLARKYGKKARGIKLNYYNPMTTSNYRKLKAILDKRGIAYVCVQYPVRSIEPLKKIFEEEKGIMFVDNEKIFKAALKNAKYKDYFTDSFGGDFGHCTPKGNRLLAENIATVILKEVFNK